MPYPTRRDVLAAGAGALALALAPGLLRGHATPWFRISLAQWSLHRSFFAKQLDHLDFARVAREEFGLEGIEYVNSFFRDKARDTAYLAEMTRRAADHGVTQLLIMCDGEGNLDRKSVV